MEAATIVRPRVHIAVWREEITTRWHRGISSQGHLPDVLQSSSPVGQARNAATEISSVRRRRQVVKIVRNQRLWVTSPRSNTCGIVAASSVRKPLEGEYFVAGTPSSVPEQKAHRVDMFSSIRVKPDGERKSVARVHIDAVWQRVHRSDVLEFEDNRCLRKHGGQNHYQPRQPASFEAVYITE